MAIIYEGVQCALCSLKLPLNEQYFATSGVFFPEGHPLFTFCDAPMHWDCYERWADRAEFARAYVQMWVDAERHNPFWGKVLLSQEVLVKVNPRIAEVSVLLVETGSDIRVNLDRWEEWIAGEWKTAGWQHPLEYRALERVVPQLQAELPTIASVVNAVDWHAKHEFHKQQIDATTDKRSHKNAKQT